MTPIRLPIGVTQGIETCKNAHIQCDTYGLFSRCHTGHEDLQQIQQIPCDTYAAPSRCHTYLLGLPEITHIGCDTYKSPYRCHSIHYQLEVIGHIRCDTKMKTRTYHINFGFGNTFSDLVCHLSGLE